MRDYCLHEVKNGRYTIACPDRSCNRIWEYFLVRHVMACLDDATRLKIEKLLTENYISLGRGYRQCPGCNTWCIPVNEGELRLQCPACSRTLGRAFVFCWACQRQWKGTTARRCGNERCDGKDPRIHILSAAETMSVDNIPGCPSIRACPNCGLLINLKEGCRHMTCISCRVEFCFICLKRWRHHHFLSAACQIAPVQTVLLDPLWQQCDDSDVHESDARNVTK